MKLSRLIRLGSQAYRAYESSKGRGGYASRSGSSGFGGSKYGGYRRGGTIERLLRRFLK